MVGIGFFAPLPLAMMMPFMAGQSMIMGDAFGKAYQYGKRKISSMTNEEFNKLTPTDLATQLQTDYLSMIPSLKASVKASTEFQSFIVKELAEIIKNLPEDVFKAITDNNPASGEVQLPGFADAATTQKEFQSSNNVDWTTLLTNLAGALLGTGRGGLVVNTGFTGETDEERHAADDLALGIIQDDKLPKVSSAQLQQIKSMTDSALSAAITSRAKRGVTGTAYYAALTSEKTARTKIASRREDAAPIIIKPSSVQEEHGKWQSVNVQFQQNVLAAHQKWNQIQQKSQSQIGLQGEARSAGNAYRQQKDGYRDWITFHRNNANHLIKVEARQLYNERRWTKL